jgi:NADH dehydrogenase FAD-containing subunit
VIKKLIDRYRLANANGRVLTKPTLQFKGYQNLWAAGDCAAMPLERWKHDAATAQFALRQGTRSGKNLLAHRANRSLRPTVSGPSEKRLPWGILNAAGDVLGFQSFGIVRLADVASCLPVQTAGLAAKQLRQFRESS